MKIRSLLLMLAVTVAFLRSPVLAGVVYNNADAGPGSLRQAILDAAAGETITFHQSLIGTIVLDPFQELVIDKNLTILGPGPDKLAISANHAGRVIYVGVGFEVFLSGLTIADGSVGVYGYGGGIWNEGTLTIKNCNVTGNSAGLYGGGIYNFGAYRPVSLTVIDSTISGNSAEDGGGIYNGARNWDASLLVETSTISGNSAGKGGGIANESVVYSGSHRTSLTVYRSTLSGNSSESGSAIYNFCDSVDGNDNLAAIAYSTISGNYSPISDPHADHMNGALVNERRIALHGDLLGRAILHVGNSTFSDNIGPIIANNSGAELFIGSTILNVSRAEFTGALAIVNSHNSKVTSVGYNLASDGGVWNRGSTGALDQMGDQLNTDPRLGPLEDNGGPTFTHSLLCASPAIDQGMNWMLSSIDQRGFARSMPVTGLSAADGTDIGAFEAQEIPVCFRVHVKGPVEQIGDLIAQINMLTQIKAATRHHLLVKLEAALKAVHSGHTATACHQMTDFIHATNAQKEKQLVPASIADDLIANGARIKVVLGCP